MNDKNELKPDFAMMGNVLNVDSLIEQGVQTTCDMQTKKGKNRNAKEIPFDIDDKTYMLDSQEEWCMFNWIKEM